MTTSKDLISDFISPCFSGILVSILANLYASNSLLLGKVAALRYNIFQSKINPYIYAYQY
ncbi:MAG: hypothetical protein Tsb006_3320 [Rickettsiaceae bacterium]